jgi:hypothetical protein
MKRHLAALLLASLPLASHAVTFEVEPTTPQMMAILRVTDPTYPYGNPVDVLMYGNHISVSVTQQPIPGLPLPPPPGGWVFRTQLGKLPEGDYVVDVQVNFATVASIPFKVAPLAGTVQPVADNTDLWWNPAESGWGLNIVQHGSTNIFATWFVYGADGNPEWYVIPDGQWVSPIEYHGSIYRATGPDIAGAFDSSKVSRTLVGSAVLRFAHGGLDADLTVDGQTTHKTLVRQSF